MTDLFSVDSLVEAGLFAHFEPVPDDGGDVSDEDDLFTLTEEIPTSGKPNLCWWGM